MEIKKVAEDMRKALQAPLPAEAVNPHPTKSYLNSIKAVYVTERMNEVFGVGGWRIKIEKESVSTEGMVVVKVIYEVPEYGIYYECYGGNDNGGEGSKNFDLGDAFKGATTDAITKIGSWLEIGIEVFKGKVTAPTNGTPKAEAKEKPWLNKWTDIKKTTTTKEWDNTVAKVKDGTVPLSKVKEVYRISKDLLAELEKLEPQPAN